MTADEVVEEIIREHPGITPPEICTQTDYAFGTVQAALYRLYVMKIIRAKWDKGIRQYHYTHILPPRGGVA